jgi:ribosome-binding protein aMBF1 (putative translation factor)
MKAFASFKKKLIKDNTIRQSYKALGPEYAFIMMIIQHRLSKGLSQADLARKIGTKQSAISRLESGRANPTVSFLRDVAKALDEELKISL